jgi:hypothetical protein
VRAALAHAEVARRLGLRSRFVASSELEERAAALEVRLTVARIGLEVRRPHLDHLGKAALLGERVIERLFRFCFTPAE